MPCVLMLRTLYLERDRQEQIVYQQLWVKLIVSVHPGSSEPIDERRALCFSEI